VVVASQHEDVIVRRAIQGEALDGALQALWTAAGKSGPCASAVVNAASGFDSLTANYHGLEAATDVSLDDG